LKKAATGARSTARVLDSIDPARALLQRRRAGRMTLVPVSDVLPESRAQVLTLRTPWRRAPVEESLTRSNRIWRRVRADSYAIVCGAAIDPPVSSAARKLKASRVVRVLEGVEEKLPVKPHGNGRQVKSLVS